LARRKRYWTEHPDELIRELERIRERLRYSMREMALALEVPFRTYQKWVYSRQKPRRPESLLARARGLVPLWIGVGCGLGLLLGGMSGTVGRSDQP